MKNKPLVDVLGLSMTASGRVVTGEQQVSAKAGNAHAPGAIQSKVEVARMENVNIGVCPCCQANMQIVTASDIECYVCEPCCVCLPTANK